MLSMDIQPNQMLGYCFLYLSRACVLHTVFFWHVFAADESDNIRLSDPITLASLRITVLSNYLTGTIVHKYWWRRQSVVVDYTLINYRSALHLLYTGTIVLI